MANYKTYRIGDVVELCTETNSDLKYGLEHVRGISNTKEIQQTKANLIERNLAPFHVVRRNEFVYNRRTSRNGERVGLGFNNTDETLLITEDYVHFRVKDENQLNPDYLYLFFKRDEFDREARYNSWGSATEFFNWDDMQAIKINVPPIEEQRRIVSEYQTVERRIQNNEQLIKKLEETAQAIYHHTFVEGIDENNLPEGWRKGCIGDLGEVVGGATPSTEKTEYWVSEGINWLSPADMPRNVMFIDHTERHITQEAYNSASTKMLPIGSVLFSSRAPIGLTAITDIELCTNQGYKSVIPLASIGSLFVYYTLIKEKEKIANQQEGSTFAEISGKELASYPIILPTSTEIENFTTKVNTIAKYRKYIERESAQLRSLLSLLTSKLS